MGPWIDGGWEDLHSYIHVCSRPDAQGGIGRYRLEHKGISTADQFTRKANSWGARVYKYLGRLAVSLCRYGQPIDDADSDSNQRRDQHIFRT
jgi:hypothetical protein